ncbi:MAG: YjbQ family protein [Armatimonadetes bacterium]|nr:YjbQ family protein [Armatimonadota bacterium]
MEANFLTDTRPNGKPQVTITQEPELRAQGIPGIHLARMVIHTSRGPQFIDITERIEELLEKAGVREGNVLIYSRHTTAGIVINENEPLLIQDMYRYLERLASPAEDYEHNNFDIRTVNMCDDECANGHAHCQHLTIGCSQHVPIVGGHLALGRWQRVFLLEMDRPRPREIMVQFIGL